MWHIPSEKLNSIILKSGFVDEKEFNKVKKLSENSGKELTGVLIENGLISEQYLTQILGEYLQVSPVDLKREKIDEEFLKLIPEEIARSRKVLVFGKEGEFLKVAMVDPGDLRTENYLSQRLKSPLRIYIASQSDFKVSLSHYKRSITREFRDIIFENIEKSKGAAGDVERMAKDLPVITILDTLLTHAASLGASDMHLEPQNDRLLVRYRIDGILHDIIELPFLIHPALIARIKILSNLKIDEHRMAQDGRFKFKLEDSEIAIRVSIMPIFYGEKAALRLLIEQERPWNLEELGFLPKDLEKVKLAISRPYGMILSTGPTGSGKTTTLYTILQILNRPEVNISTIEDPIEYDIKRINQIQVNPKTGITFAEGLRSLLRQDPDILMVGEVRDLETAEMAVHSALTGHLLLSTLHTNDAPGAIPRLLDLGVQAFLLSSTLNLIIAQRLVRRICQNCLQRKSISPQLKIKLETELKTVSGNEKLQLPKTIYQGKGCENCSHTGYKGQVGLFEVLSVSPEIQNLITSRVSASEIRKVARRQGMTTILEDGFSKIEAGVTTVEEVLRVTRE